MRKAIHHGNASFEDIRNVPNVHPSGKDRSIVIYIWKFKGILNRGNGDNGLYAGKSITLGNRYTRHMSALQSDSKEYGAIYEIGRPAAEKEMSIFARFPTNTPSLPTVLQVAEQVAQLLFGTMNQDLFIDDGYDETAAAKWFADRLAARTLTSLAAAVFAKTGWKPPMGIQGCNWLSALTEAQSTMSLWLCRDVLDHGGNPMRVFTTGGRGAKVYKSQRGKNKPGKEPGLRFVLITGGRDSRGQVVIAFQIAEIESQDIKAGTIVYPIVEFYLGNQDIAHPVPYARLPEPGPFSDWSMLNKVGKC
jgi:hypothetical protein